MLPLRNTEYWRNKKLEYRVDRTDSENVDRAETSAPKAGAGLLLFPRWFDLDEDLCSGCWAMRIDAGLDSGSECWRCGRRRRKGFEEAGSKRGTGRSEEQEGPVSWKAFRKVSDGGDEGEGF